MRDSAAGYLFVGLGLLSILLLTVETSTRLLDPVRGFVGSIVSPIYVVAESPYLLTNAVSDVIATRDQLLARNQELQRRILELSQISQQYITLKTENDRLRALLGSQGRLPYEVMIAELVGVVPDPNTYQIIIDKGSDSGIEQGLAVLDAQGLFGQVIEVGRFTSRVLLVNDSDHAVPVRVNRNGVRAIAGGTGDIEHLVLENVSISADIVEGDLIEKDEGLIGSPAAHVEPTGDVGRRLARGQEHSQGDGFRGQWQETNAAESG